MFTTFFLHTHYAHQYTLEAAAGAAHQHRPSILQLGVALDRVGPFDTHVLSSKAPGQVLHYTGLGSVIPAICEPALPLAGENRTLLRLTANRFTHLPPLPLFARAASAASLCCHRCFRRESAPAVIHEWPLRPVSLRHHGRSGICGAARFGARLSRRSGFAVACCPPNPQSSLLSLHSVFHFTSRTAKFRSSSDSWTAG